MRKKEIIFGIDPGESSSGLVILVDGKLSSGSNLINEDLFTLIDKHCYFTTDSNLTVVYEDVRPYQCRNNMATINTCKMLGRLEYVLKQQRVPFKGISRNEIKNFIYKTYPETVLPDVDKKILYGVESGRMKRNRDGNPPKSSFLYVDDRIVKRAMKVEWNIPNPKPGKNNEYGIKDHSWQALGAVTCYLHMLNVGTGYFDKRE